MSTSTTEPIAERIRHSRHGESYIPKADGRQRSLGVAALEDKVVQQAVVTILNEIYEVDFRGFSYGFRPGRNPHQVLDALAMGIQMKRVNWVLDADRKCSLPHCATQVSTVRRGANAS